MAPTPPPSGDPMVSHLLGLAQEAMRQGDLAAAANLCSAVLGRDPGNPQAAGFVISRALEDNDPARACAVAEQALAHAPNAALHFLHGRALAAMGDPAGARGAFARAYQLDGRMFPALLWRGAQEQALDAGDAHLATYQRALALAAQAGALEPDAQLAADTRQRLQQASDVLHAARRSAVEAVLAPIRARHGAEAIKRIDAAVAMSLGETDIAWQHPLQRPTFMLVPGLEPRAWFEREELPFLAEIERQTDAIREELRGVLADQDALVPYVDMPADAPSAPVWRELNRSARWSSYHLFRHGERIEAHCERCPRTVAALASIPVMRVPEHSPEALFSLLKPGTRIPSHTGVINGRLTVHLPLVVPRDCGALKAGDEARGWQEGRCLVFDDSFAHEAWNESGEDRVVLIFDVWDPRLEAPEREAMAAAIVAIGRFNRACGSGDRAGEES